ncbi:MAG: histidine phosphatase family protein [Candidatus Competibacteraceae bacterium]|jgi:phosphohistidine phosphatase|nr:histidine phosphatase family protein [Candidatus Competibacteraceae bacterium]
MSRQLLILRHAKSDWDNEVLTDFDRPLAERGKKDAPRMGAWLHEQGLIPDYVVSSPAKRAKQTVRKVCKELGIADAEIHWEPRIYEASRYTLGQVLADCPAQAQRVLLVGHNPGLENLLAFLCDSVPLSADGKLLPTATVAQLAMPEDWSQLDPSTAQLLQLTRPRSLA